jgi:hypothetical protein
MARRSGVLHGVLVFVLSLVIGAIVGGIASQADGVDVEQNLRSIGVPTTWDQVEDVAIGGAILSLAMILLGSILGGMLGERWHTKLARRVADPAYGPAAEERARVEADAIRRRQSDPLVHEEGERERLRREADRRDDEVVDVRDRDDAVRADAARADAGVEARSRQLDAREAELAAREEALTHHRGPTDLRS